MKIENLCLLISRMKTLREDEFDMAHVCGTACCITGWCKNWFDEFVETFLGLDRCAKLIMPDGFGDRKRYPLKRGIETLERLRDTYVLTGEVVVDWGPEPGEEHKTPWVAPHVFEVIAPTLPAEITSLLRPSLAKTEA